MRGIQRYFCCFGDCATSHMTSPSRVLRRMPSQVTYWQGVRPSSRSGRAPGCEIYTSHSSTSLALLQVASVILYQHEAFWKPKASLLMLNTLLFLFGQDAGTYTILRNSRYQRIGDKYGTKAELSASASLHFTVSTASFPEQCADQAGWRAK
jgi:hypothetical protein